MAEKIIRSTISQLFHSQNPTGSLLNPMPGDKVFNLRGWWLLPPSQQLATLYELFPTAALVKTADNHLALWPNPRLIKVFENDSTRPN